jgi:phosphate transport system substrate-binding protein
MFTETMQTWKTGLRATAGILVLSLYMAWVVIASLRAEDFRLITIDGSSTVFPITEAAAEEFQAIHRGRIRVTVGISGTGGGFKKFCRGETDIQDASRPIAPEEREVCRRKGIAYHELPVAYDAMTIVVSRQNTWVESITLEELKRVWEPSAQRTVSRWNQVRPGWPDAPLTLFGAGSDSGTFDYFTEVVVGRAKASRGDYTASEDDNTLVQGIARDKYALGYIPFGYYETNRHRIKAVPVDAGSGPRAPSRDTVENGTYQPLSRPLLIYVNDKSASRPEIRSFVNAYLSHAAEWAAEVGFIPLPAAAYALAAEQFRSGRLGTVFHTRAAAGIPLIDVLKQDAML